MGHTLYFNAANLGIGIYSVLACALGTIALVWSLCQTILPGRIGLSAAFLSLSLILSVHYFSWLSQELMADIPIVCTSMAALVAFVRCEKPSGLSAFAVGGVATALALLMRLTNLALCLPFLLVLLRSPTRPVLIRRAGVLLTPIALAGGILLVYQKLAFGDFLYTGYHYWVPARHYRLSSTHLMTAVPKMFHLFNAPHLRTSVWDWYIGPFVLFLPTLLAPLCRKYQPSTWRRILPVLRFLATMGIPTVVFFALYPFASARFMLFVHVVWLTVGAIWALSLLDRLSSRLGPVAALFAVASVLPFHPPGGSLEKSYDLCLLELLDASLSQNAVLIGAIDELRADWFFVHGSERRFIPLSPFGSFERWKVGRSGALRQPLGGCSATTCPEQIEALLGEGRRVYLATQLSRWRRQGKYIDALLARFSGKRVFDLLQREAVVELSLK